MNDKELIEFLCEENEAFAKDLADGHDPISTFDGHFVAWDEIIDACGNGREGYSQSPLELISRIINERDDLQAEFQATKDMLFAVTAVCNGSSAMEHLDAFRNADTMLQESEKEKFRAALDEITHADGTPAAPKHVSRSAIIQIAKNVLAESV